MEGFKWLHFSDLHLSCDSFDEKDAKEKLIGFIKKERKLGQLEYDYIFISGDIANGSVYDGAEKFLEELFSALGLENTKEGLNNVFWSVGNHDILRDEESNRYKWIQEIRNSESSLTLGDCIDGDKKSSYKHLEKRSALIDVGMSLFKDFHLKILKRDYETNHGEPHVYIQRPQFNLVILNTCLTSVDDEDTHNLYIKSEELRGVFGRIKEKDKDKPILVLGHHGRDFFEMGDMDALSDVFDDKGVDMYLCGHNHRLGFALFPDTGRNIYQFTCGGGNKFAHGAVFSFMHGEFNGNDCSVHITPYSYRDSGNKEWGIDYQLNKRFKADNIFLLERLKNKNVKDYGAALKEVATTVELDDCIGDDSSDYVNILHLSDLQFGITARLSGKDEVAIRERELVLEKKLLSHLQNKIPRDWMPDIIVISGDLAWSASKSDYKRFGNWLKKLLGVLHVPIQNVILCTGNHDISSLAAKANSRDREACIKKEDKGSDNKGYQELINKVNKELIPDASEGNIYGRFNEFISFCKGEIDSEIAIMPLKNILPEESESRYLYGYRDILGLRFNVLNTSWYCGDNVKKESSSSDKNYLWIGEQFVKDLTQNLERNDKYSVTVFHHPFDWLNPNEGDDNAAVKKKLLKFSDIILCGHVHTKVGEPTFEHNRAQIFQSGALWERRDYTYESRIIKINKRTGLIKQRTIEYNAQEEVWENKPRIGPNMDHTYPINVTKHPEGQFENGKMRGIL